MFKRKQHYTIAKRQRVQTPTNKVTMCLNCLTQYSAMPINKLCTKCKGIVTTFDSQMESKRYIYLKEQPNITSIKVQSKFYRALPEAIYEYGLNREPILVKYSEKITEHVGYKVDFAYYDDTTLKGWVAEEFKPYDQAMDTENKRKLVDAYDQHKGWGHFCYSYPENNMEGNKLRPYKRMFVTRPKKQVRYQSFDEMFG